MTSRARGVYRDRIQSQLKAPSRRPLDPGTIERYSKDIGISCIRRAVTSRQWKPPLIQAPVRTSAFVLLVAVLVLAGGRAERSTADVVINEVAWMGTAASTSDEWIELRNNTDCRIDLHGWTLRAQDGAPSITLSGVLTQRGFYLLERTDNSTVADIVADQIYAGSMSDTGETLVLRDPTGRVVDTANGDGGAWPAGNKTTRSTMERVNPARPDENTNWRTNDRSKQNGKDAKGAILNGTPRAENSCTNPPDARFAFRVDSTAPWCTILFSDESIDRDGRIVAWTWDLGDGSVSTDQGPIHQYRSAGVQRVTLLVWDNDGLSDSAQIDVPIVDTRGDVDGNGVVDVVDVRLALQIALGFLNRSIGGRAADVDEDGNVDADDALHMARRVIGL